MIIQKLNELGFVENVDFTFVNGTLLAVQKSRMVDGLDEQGQPTQVEEFYFEPIPSLEEIKKMILRGQDHGLLIMNYVGEQSWGEGDNINLLAHIDGLGGWRSSTIPAPTIDELYLIAVEINNAI